MSYDKMMKWNKKHPKGTKQTCIMHTASGFTPSESYTKKYFKYVAACEKEGLLPISMEEHYKSQIR